MQAEDVSFDDGGQRKVVEQLGEVLPNICIAIFTKAFIIEAVNLGNLLCLMISTKDGDAIGISHLHANKQSDALH